MFSEVRIGIGSEFYYGQPFFVMTILWRRPQRHPEDETQVFDDCLRSILRLSKRRAGPLFRRISTASRIGDAALHPDAVRPILSYRAMLLVRPDGNAAGSRMTWGAQT